METAYCGGLSTGGAGFFPPHLFWPAPLVSEEAAPVVEGMPARFRCAARRHGEGVPAHVCRAARGAAWGSRAAGAARNSGPGGLALRRAAGGTVAGEETAGAGDAARNRIGSHLPVHFYRRFALIPRLIFQALQVGGVLSLFSGTERYYYDRLARACRKPGGGDARSGE